MATVAGWTVVATAAAELVLAAVVTAVTAVMAMARRRGLHQQCQP